MIQIPVGLFTAFIILLVLHPQIILFVVALIGFKLIKLEDVKDENNNVTHIKIIYDEKKE